MRAGRGNCSRLALATFALALLAVAVPLPAAASGGAYYAAVERLDGALRVAIEREPDGLAKILAASERVCELGQRAERDGEQAAAAADWNALDQIVERLDEPGLAAVERAFAEARRSLSALESRFGRAWPRQPARARELHRGARSVRGGIRQVTGGFSHLRDAFGAWRGHQCEGALAALDSFSVDLPAGVMAINRGMWRIWMVPGSPAGSPSPKR